MAASSRPAPLAPAESDASTVRASASRIGGSTEPDASARLPPAGAGPAPAPENVPGYRIVRPIASGGMGTVYEAEQLNPKRRVALKVVKPGMASPDLLRRFEFEARALAQLDHPGVARIYQAGTFDSGAGPQPFFAMEFVDGLSLDKWAEERKLSTRARIELMARVCDAVEHAHQKGIIHRDLKPGNILVVDDGAGGSGGVGAGAKSGGSGGSSAIGQPKVLDFGLARATDSDVQTVSMQTEAGQILGTVRYMSPEQTTGRPEAVDTRSDVYSLGVIAYEVLTGRNPLSIPDRVMIDALRSICDEDPIPAGTIDRTLRGDVETILGKALEKERSRRYGAASDLASDLRRYLVDEPIAARPPSASYQLKKFARRNPWLVASSGLVVTILAVAVVLVGVLARRAARERDEAEFQRIRAEENRLRAEDLASSALKEKRIAEDALRQVRDLAEHMKGAARKVESLKLENVESGAILDVALGEIVRSRQALTEATSLRIRDEPSTPTRARLTMEMIRDLGSTNERLEDVARTMETRLARKVEEGRRVVDVARLLRDAEVAAKTGDLPEALGKLELVLEQDPGNPVALARRRTFESRRSDTGKPPAISLR